ncbi:transmembrane protein 229A-like [Littorina saxatilis]|uniref:Transmembrane protein 229A n=1 Tax=Littorina saxatilis TaxID=31220 RepID=A0AAN9BBE8_9CAEN
MSVSEANGIKPNGKRRSEPPEKVMTPLPAWARFYFYGMHGLLDEVVFTALFDLFLEPGGNSQLKGCSTLTSFFLYGSCTFLVEQLFVYCVRRGYSLIYRLPVYVLFVYIWELSWGLVLRQFGLCSWDYSHYPLNLLGLITLVYAPGWMVLCVLQDLIYGYIFSLHVVDTDHKVKLA